MHRSLFNTSIIAPWFQISSNFSLPRVILNHQFAGYFVNLVSRLFRAGKPKEGPLIPPHKPREMEPNSLRAVSGYAQLLILRETASGTAQNPLLTTTSNTTRTRNPIPKLPAQHPYLARRMGVCSKTAMTRSCITLHLD